MPGPGVGPMDGPFGNMFQNMNSTDPAIVESEVIPMIIHQGGNPIEKILACFLA